MVQTEKGENGTKFERVEWPDASCTAYRLPTEAEWEYAARADQPYQYAGSNDLDRVAWHSGNAKNTTHPVAQKDSNAWFLHDMSGNVWEWVWDWYSDTYQGAETQDPRGPRVGVNRVLRGGSFCDGAVSARVAGRGRYGPTSRVINAGFRLARSLP